MHIFKLTRSRVAFVAVITASFVMAMLPAGAQTQDEAYIVPFLGSSTPTSYHTYFALDFALAEGTPVIAAGKGVVSLTADDRNCNPYDYGAVGENIQPGVDGCKQAFPNITGNRVEVTHPGGSRTNYLHLEGFAPGLQTGAPVEAGDVIGYVGNTGISTGPHLHYEEIDANGNRVAPGDMEGCLASGDKAVYTSVSAGSPIVNDNIDCLTVERPDFDGDDTSDLFLYGLGSATDRLLVFEDNDWTFGPTPTISGTYEGHAGDFDGDGDLDIFWYGPGSDPDRISVNNGDGVFGVRTPRQINGTYEIIR